MNSLKCKIVFAFALGLMITFNSCEHDSFLNSACGVNDPLTNLPWLKDYVKNMKSNTQYDYTNIDYYKHNSEYIIEIKWRLIGVEDLPTGQLYSCNGVELYSCGGNQPIDSCTIIIKESQLIGSLWEKK